MPVSIEDKPCTGAQIRVRVIGLNEFSATDPCGGPAWTHGVF